jgi:hypothetical protein
VTKKEWREVSHDGGRLRLKREKVVRFDFDIAFDEQRRVERKKDVDVNAVGRRYEVPRPDKLLRRAGTYSEKIVKLLHPG